MCSLALFFLNYYSLNFICYVQPCVCVCVYIYMQNLVEKTIWPMPTQESLKVLSALKLFSLRGKNFLK